MNVIKEGHRLFNTERNEYYPWYTHPALAVLEKLDFSEMAVFEYGAGDSSAWWAKRCKHLCCVESDKEWADTVAARLPDAEVFHNDKLIQYLPDWTPVDIVDPDLYVHSIARHSRMFDVIVIDGVDREECVEPALLKLNAGGMIIYDNWMQPSVMVQSEKTQQRLLAFRHEIYQQPGHDDWKTALFYP